MFLVFMDESGTIYSTYEAYLKRTGSALLVIGALGIRESQLGLIDQWFQEMKRRFLGSEHALAPRAHEIKGSILYNLRRGTTPSDWIRARRRERAYTADQKRIWNALSPHSLEELERSIFDLLRRVKPVVWIIAIKQDKLYGRYETRTWHPLYWALTFMQQRATSFVSAKYGTYERALIMTDENSNLSKAWQYDDFLRTRATINDRTQWPADFDTYLVGAPVFGQSHLHQALQLADIVAHAGWRHVNRDDTLNWYARMDPFLARHWSTGGIENAGLTFIQ